MQAGAFRFLILIQRRRPIHRWTSGPIASQRWRTRIQIQRAEAHRSSACGLLALAMYILASCGFFGDVNMAANIGDRYLDLIQKSVQNAIHGESQVEAAIAALLQRIRHPYLKRRGAWSWPSRVIPPISGNGKRCIAWYR